MWMVTFFCDDMLEVRQVVIVMAGRKKRMREEDKEDVLTSPFSSSSSSSSRRSRASAAADNSSSLRACASLRSRSIDAVASLSLFLPDVPARRELRGSTSTSVSRAGKGVASLSYLHSRWDGG